MRPPVAARAARSRWALLFPPAPFPALSTMDGEAVRGRVLGFCSARRVVARDEVDEAHKLCEALKAYLVARGKALLASEPTRAVLFSYGSDATPLMTRKVFRQSRRPCGPPPRLRLGVRDPLDP